MRGRIFHLALAALLLAAPLRAADKATNFSGTYTVQGQKGAITLTLQADAEGNLTGSFKGGDLQATLKGFPNEDGGVLGTMTGVDGAFMSYFQVAREGDKLHFDIVQANQDGDPDFTKKSRLTFPAQPGGAAPKSEPKTEPNAAAGGFTGTFKNDELTLESKAEGASGSAYSGTIKMAGQTFTFTAQGQGDTLRGQFASPDGKFPFQATLDGRTLTFTTEGTTYTLQKQGGNPLAKPEKPAPSNPLAKPGTSPSALLNTPSKPATTAALPAKSSGDGNAWKIFKHATGLSVRYPPDWKIGQQNGVGLLTPPNLASSAQGPLEAYLILADGAQGVQRIDDPQVPPYLDQVMQQIFPFLQRAGEPQKLVASAAPGLLMTWEGTNPLGLTVRANVMATILKGYAIALLSVGDKSKIAAREGVLKEIFASLAAGAGERDAQLVGGWKFWGYKSSADGKFGTETSRRFRFQPDGTCYWQSSSESSGVFKEGSFAGQNTGGVERGQWTAANGELYVLWDDGTTGTWAYEVRATPNGKRLFLKGSQAKADEWVAE